MTWHPLLNIAEPAPRAAMFAIGAHEATGQVRKYVLSSYTVHLAEVAQIVWETTGDPLMTAAAWLHDVVEDTKVTSAVVHALFGREVGVMVAGMTEPEAFGYANREARKTAYRLQLAASGWAVQTIKYADIISNTRTVHRFKPLFRERYLMEIQQTLESLTDGHAGLYAQAKEVVFLAVEAHQHEFPDA